MAAARPRVGLAPEGHRPRRSAGQALVLPRGHGNLQAGAAGLAAHGVYRSCGGGQPSLLAVTVGVSVGWADIYGPNSFQQWIDITHVPDGTYFLYSKADPNNFFQESNNNDNVTWTKISISGTTVKVLQFGPHI